MPRAARASALQSNHSGDPPYPKNAPKKFNEASKSKPETKSKPRTGKDSHLYTDDNPATTLHGTGFKDAATARRTIDLVQQRSLLYQFQTINTMYYRAKHHPQGSNSKDMQAAMAVFREWLDVTYLASKEAQIDFKLLRKDVVEKYLPKFEDKGWAERYVELPKGKRLANVLANDDRPGEADLARARQDHLEDLIKERGNIPTKDDESLWDGEDVSTWHLKCIAYAWSPVKPAILINRARQ